MTSVLETDRHSSVSPAGDYRQGRNMLVVWRVTTSCNLGCGFCIYSRESELPRQHSNPMSIRAFGDALVDYGERTEQSVRISWLGGEPFLWQPIHEVSKQLGETGVSLSATTNGTALGASKVVGTLRRWFDVLHISLDGMEGSHDRSRGRDGLFGKILSDTSRLMDVETGLAVGANLLLTAESILQIERLFRQMGDAGMTFASFNPLIVDESTDAAPRRLLPEHLPLLEVLESDRQGLFERTGVQLLGSHEYFERVRSYVCGEPIAVGVEECRPGSSRLFVDEHGRIRPCSFVQGDERPVFVSSITTADDILALDHRFSRGIGLACPKPCLDCMDPYVFGKFDAAI